MQGRVILSESATPGRVDVASPYSAKNFVKAIPGARWDPDRRVWTIPQASWKVLQRDLEAGGFSVEVTWDDDDGTEALRREISVLRDELQRARATGAGEAALRREIASLKAELSRARSTGGTFAALFRELPAPLREPTYKALARVLHPDVGGDAELMKRLNSAGGR